MSDQERLSTLQSYAWTLELLGEALVQHDEMLECEHNPRLSFRNTAGIHQAIRIISRLASEQCHGLLESVVDVFTTSGASARECRSVHIVDPDVSRASSLIKKGMNMCARDLGTNAQQSSLPGGGHRVLP